MENVITFLACICFIFIFGRIFIVPIRKILKIVLNSVLGGFAIFIINLVGVSFGFHIGLNLFTCILVGILGLPGAVFLIVVRLLVG
jgi:inhibitor of the pro-sigma K processing machinery